MSEAVLAAVQEAMSRISKDLGKAIAAVDGLGKMLMMKYDAETTELKRVVAEQRAEIQELKRSASGIEAAKVAALLSRVSDQLNSMRTP